MLQIFKRNIFEIRTLSFFLFLFDTREIISNDIISVDIFHSICKSIYNTGGFDIKCGLGINATMRSLLV